MTTANEHQPKPAAPSASATPATAATEATPRHFHSEEDETAGSADRQEGHIDNDPPEDG